MTEDQDEIRIRYGDDKIAYIELPGYPRGRDLKISRSLRLVDLIGKYDGPELIMDFDADGRLVGLDVDWDV